MLVVGGIIGSGIFLNPTIVAQRLGSTPLIMATWALGAVVALLGAVIFAELGARHPAAGGGYAYLREAFGDLPAFLYGWALLLAIASGAAAAVAVIFASYAAPLLGIARLHERWLAAGAIALLSLVNAAGVRPGAWTQNVFTMLKLLALALVIYSPFSTMAPMDIGLRQVSPVNVMAVGTHWEVMLAVGSALVPVLFSYGGWQQANFVAEEMIEPQRNLPRALVAGVGVVAVVYLAVNLAYLAGLGVQGLASSTAPAADLVGTHHLGMNGFNGWRAIRAGIAISTFGFLNLLILVTPRVYQAMARDGLFFASLAAVHPRTRTPVRAIALQGAGAIVLLASGSYGALLDWVTFADWIFFGLTAATLLVYRRRDTTATVPGFRAPMYRTTVLLFVAASVYVVLGAIVSNPANALRGTLVLAAGIPVFHWWSRRRASDSLGR